MAFLIAFQRRTRERLVNVLTTCGHTVGLKQSPSVVFSSSSDLAVEKQAAGQQPSSEEASLVEGLTSEPAKDELEPHCVMTNFDFLYDEADDVAWGPEYEDGRSSYGSLEVPSLERELKANLTTLGSLSGSEPDLTPHESSDEEDEVQLSQTHSKPLSPNSDLNQIAHCNIKGLSVRKVMRTEDVITQVKFS